MVFSRRELLAGVAALAFPLGVPAAEHSPLHAHTLHLAHTASTTHVHQKAVEHFSRILSSGSHMHVKVEVYPAGELGDQPVLLEKVMAKSIDMAIVSVGNLAMYDKRLNAMTAPFLFESYRHAHKTIDSYVMQWMNEGLAQYDLIAIAMFDYGFRQVTTRGIRVRKAGDLKGVKIRIPPAQGLLAAFDALGADTHKIAYPKLLDSLEKGEVAAEENPVFTILADGLYKVQNELSLTNHYFDCQALIISKSLFDSFTSECRRSIRRAAHDAQEYTREMIEADETLVINELRKKGMHITHPDRDSFIMQMEPAYVKVGELAGSDELEKLLAAASRAAKH